MKQLTTLTISVAAAALAVTGLTGCGSDDDDSVYQPVCMDQVTHARLDDDACGDDHDGGISTGDAVLLWMLLGSRSSTTTYVVPVGSRIPDSGYVRTLPARARVATVPAPRAGGYVAPNPKAAEPADRWVQRNPQYRGRVQDSPAPKPSPAVKTKKAGWFGGGGKKAASTPKPAAPKRQWGGGGGRQKPAGGYGGKRR